MHTLKFLAEVSANDVVERDFIVDGVPGVIWSPTSGAERAPIVLLGHGGGLHKKTPAQVARAHQYVTGCGYHVVAIDAPGHGDRPRSPADERARAELRQAMLAGDTEQVSAVSLRYGASLAERAVPEWQATLDALQKLPEIGHEAPIGYGGGITLGTGIGIPLTAVEPRISVPVQFLLPWDDEHVDRQSSLALFDAFASEEKTLHANPGDHRTIRWFGLDTEFLPRHLGRPSADASSLLVNTAEQGPRGLTAAAVEIDAEHDGAR